MRVMVTAEQLREQLSRRPFAPFRLVLVDGETIDIGRTAQAVATAREVMIATPGGGMRRVALATVARVAPLQPRAASPPISNGAVPAPGHSRLWELTHRNPFQPFRITLSGGEVIDVIQRFSCVVMPRQFVVEAPEGHIKFYALDDLDRVDELQAV